MSDVIEPYYLPYAYEIERKFNLFGEINIFSNDNDVGPYFDSPPKEWIPRMLEGYKSFYKLRYALELIKFCKARPLSELAEAFGEFSRQEIKPEIVEAFNFTGLDNIDFLTSGFLSGYGLKNLTEFMDGEGGAT